MRSGCGVEGGIEARAWVLLGPFQFFLRGDAGIGLGYKADPKGLGPLLEPFQFFMRGDAGIGLGYKADPKGLGPLLEPFQFFLRGDAGIGLGYKADPKGLGPPLEPFQFFLRGMLMRSVCEVYAKCMDRGCGCQAGVT